MSMYVSRRRFLAVTGVAAGAAATGTLWRLMAGDPARRPIPSVPLTPTTGPWVDEAANGYVATAPKVLRSGQSENIALSLFQGERGSNTTVKVSLLKDKRTIAQASGRVAGRGTVTLDVPQLDEGDYQLQISGKGFEDQAPVRVEDGTVLLLETDKPVYKPGQTVHIRALAVDAMLRPVSGEATVEVMDAKGTKVFKKPVKLDDFGMASLDLPLSTEPNLGVWKLRATAGRRGSELDVRVERYVLPKYEVKLNLPKEWALVSDAISGAATAEYSFGKPVGGELEIKALRYVGAWEEYARVTKPIDGKTPFELPAVGYAAGAPAAGGNAQVRLDVVVREEATGYEESTSQLITVVQTPVSIRVIPESNTFKPGLPFALLVFAETPDKRPVDASVKLRLSYMDENYNVARNQTFPVRARNGFGRLALRPPQNAVSLSVEASGPNGASTSLSLQAGYSPSATFIHVEQRGRGPLKVGGTARFKVSATQEAVNFYYEVVARGKVAYSSYSDSDELAITLTPEMAPESRLLVYQVLSDGEVAADYLPFEVEGDYPQAVKLSAGRAEARPGDALDVSVQTDGPARVGLVAVDKSVFILAENRLNLQGVFDELERLYLEPQAELHEGEPVEGDMPRRDVIMPDFGMPGEGMGGYGEVRGAKEMFADAGLLVLTNRKVPEGQELVQQRREMIGGGVGAEDAAVGAPQPVMAATQGAAGAAAEAPALNTGGAAGNRAQAEVQRVRRYFPETWIWSDLTTDRAGRATQRAVAPDSITTWMLRAVALSKEKGLGIGEAELRVFQPFFVSIDLPYSAVRGEEFPAKVALYNYSSSPETFVVELEGAGWFDALDARAQTVTVAPNDVGVAAFTIRPRTLGVQKLSVTARGQRHADAIIKELIVEPEGIAREEVRNLVLSAGAARTLDLSVPTGAVAGSGRAQVALTGNVMSQTMEGLEGLLQMPFGCGEQNMLLFAPDVFVTRYLKESGQLKPEIMAKAELLMLTGYQRELTYRRDDGSFSAFGDQDPEGSLWLTAFVLKTFAQARDIIFVDENILGSASDWIRGHQARDGSFAPVGFVHHPDMFGGVTGKTTLTAYVAIALLEARDGAASSAIRYLEGKLGATRDTYSLAIVAYALALAGSRRAWEAREKLLKLARESDEGLYWGSEVQPLTEGSPEAPVGIEGGMESPRPRGYVPAIETTGYATLALLQGGDLINAGRAARWLASQRNAYGGFGSTQDTVVALQAMSTAASRTRFPVDATVLLKAGGWRKEVRVNPGNADVLQIVDVPAGGKLTAEARGRGQVMAQAVRRYSLPAAQAPELSAFELDVRYGSEGVEVDDIVDVTAAIRFTPREPVAAGMVVLDIAVPTGFSAVEESIDALVKRERKLKRWDLAGRKVIFYIEDMRPREKLKLSFQVRALHPVRAQAVGSQVYAYYRPEWKGESLGTALTVGARAG